MATKTNIVFTSAARTTHSNSATINARDAKAITFEINVTAFTGTSIVFTVQDYDRAVGVWYTLLASAAISATGRSRLTISPTTVTAANVGLNAVVSPELRIVPSGTITSVTYDIVAQISR